MVGLPGELGFALTYPARDKGDTKLARLPDSVVPAAACHMLHSTNELADQ